jgi:twitching motility protein PilT
MNTKDHFFGEVAIALSLLGRADVDRVMRVQRRKPKSTIGQICRQLGLLTETEVELVLSEQQRILERRRSARVERARPRLAALKRQGVPDPRPAVDKPPPIIERSRAASDRRAPRDTPAAPAAPVMLADELLSGPSGDEPPTRRARRTRPARPAPAPPPEQLQTLNPTPPSLARASTPTSDRHGDLLGRLAVDSGLLTMDQLGVLTRQQGRETGKLIGELLVEKGYSTRQQIDELLVTQRQLRSRTQELRAVAKEPPVDLGVTLDPALPDDELLEADPHGATLPTYETDTPLTLDARSMTAEVPIAVESHRHSDASAEPTKERSPTPETEDSPLIASGSPASGAEPASDLDGWLQQAVQRGASDVLLHAGAPIKLRRLGELEDLNNEPLADETSRALLLGALDDVQRDQLAEAGELDLAYTAEVGRFRANIYEDHRGLCGVFHFIPAAPPTLFDLDLPSDLAKVVNVHQGLVLITGPAGCGKTSTLAALVNILNEERSDHILTAEDPVEYLHRSKSCLVNQRQVRRDTASFGQALRAALREDPDVICIGELRDLETISLALSAAETGHLVLATMHNASAIRAINSLVGAYPPEQQPQVRTMLSESLRAVIAQRLLPRQDGDGMALALELLLANRAVSNLIRENRTFQLGSVLQMGKAEGMRMLDHSLRDLVERDVISAEVARAAADNPDSFAR